MERKLWQRPASFHTCVFAAAAKEKGFELDSLILIRPRLGCYLMCLEKEAEAPLTDGARFEETLWDLW